MNRVLSSAVASAFVLLVLAGCTNFFDAENTDGESSASVGSLVVTIEEPLTTSTIQPDIDMIISQYTVSVTGPGEAQSVTGSESELTIEDLEPGDWTVTVNAKNADGVVIASDSATAGVNAGEATALDMTVVPLSGEGTLGIRVTWPEHGVRSPSVEAEMTPLGDGSVSILGFVIDGTEGVFEDSFGAGYWTLTISLKDESEVLWSRAVAVRIIANEMTSGVFSLSAEDLGIESGTLQATVSADIRNPYSLSFSDFPEVVHGRANVEINLDPNESPDGIKWYLNGQEIENENGATLEIGPGLNSGTHWLDAIVSKGEMSSSTGASFRVANTVDVSLGGSKSMILFDDGTLWSTGYNWAGQLGDGTTISRSVPVLIASNVASVSSGTNHVAILKNDGTLWMAGYNIDGQLGDGTQVDRYTPVKTMENVAAVSARGAHTMIVKTDGSLWGTGRNTSGEIGDGTLTNRLSPVEIMQGVAAVETGLGQTWILKSDGSLWATGGNDHGQLGDGTTTHRSTPAVVEVTGEIAAISGSAGHFLILRTDGVLLATGRNNYGQLGDSTTSNRLTPVQIMEDVAKVSAGAHHSLFVKNDGSLWATGWNEYGQLGDGTTVNRSTPVKIMDDVAEAYGGLYHTMILRTDGSLWVTGGNQYGQFGNGTASDSLIPTPVFGS